MKFVLLVEGATERKCVAEFLKRWLDPRLNHRVGIDCRSFHGYGDLLRDLTKRVRLHLDGTNRREIIAVIALVDLYGPDFYPKATTSASQRIAWGKSHFEGLVAEPRFRFFFAAHEFEAWLLSQPTIFPQPVAAAISTKTANPESVNFDEPPSKLFDGQYRRLLKRSYKKTTVGVNLFKKLDPELAYAKCPRLKELLDEMLKLAQAAGL